jgi:drug/metabolite transporter (DMT)-like permease
MNSPKPTPVSPVLILFIGVLATSASAILVRLAQAEAPSLAIATWRLVMASLILLPGSLALRRSEIGTLRPVDWRLALFAGAMLAVHFASWITSLAYTSVASSVVLVTTTPLWVGLASPFVLGESLTRKLKIGIILALIGGLLVAVGDLVALESGRLVIQANSPDAGSQPLLGNGLALLGAWSAAAYFLVGRRLRPQLSLLSYTTLVYGTAAVCLLAIALVAGTPLLGYTPLAYLLFLLMAIFPQLLGHSAYNWALGYLAAAYVSVAVISEPIGATVLAFIIFREMPAVVVLVGAAFILTGILIASSRGR